MTSSSSACDIKEFLNEHAKTTPVPPQIEPQSGFKLLYPLKTHKPRKETLKKNVLSRSFTSNPQLIQPKTLFRKKGKRPKKTQLYTEKQTKNQESGNQ